MRFRLATKVANTAPILDHLTVCQCVVDNDVMIVSVARCCDVRRDE